MALGEILDQAGALLKNHFAMLITITAFLFMPAQAVLVYHQLTMPQPPAATATQEEQLQYFRDLQTHAFSPLYLTVAFALLVIVIPLTNAATIRAIASVYLGAETTAMAAFRGAFQKFLPLLGTSMLVGLAIMGVMIAACLPMIITPLLGLVTILPAMGIVIYLAFRFWLMTQVVVLEDLSGMKALSRSGELMKGNYGTVFVLGLVVGIIQVMVSGAAVFVPVLALHIIINVLVAAVLFLFAAAASVVFYFSCRCKLENFDLTILANSVGEEQPAGASAPAAPEGN
jgi:hypothetical protein